MGRTCVSAAMKGWLRLRAGSDSASFFSAVVSGAAGSYIVTLTVDAVISADLTIRPGQDVRISGDALLVPLWGSGGFTVQQSGTVFLTFVAMAGALNVDRGGSFTAQSSVMSGAMDMLVAPSS